MRSHYTITVMLNSYLDHIVEGQVSKEFSTECSESGKSFDSPQDALRYFYKKYGGDKHGICKFDNEGVRFSISYMAVGTKLGFEEPTEAQMEQFKQGMLDLWDVEYVLMVNEIAPVKEFDLSNLGFEVEEA